MIESIPFTRRHLRQKQRSLSVALGSAWQVAAVAETPAAGTAQEALHLAQLRFAFHFHLSRAEITPAAGAQAAILTSVRWVRDRTTQLEETPHATSDP
jgi:hypothetical protein